MNKIQDRLQKLAEELSGGKYTVFAKKCGIPHSTFQNYMNGRMPHSDHLLRIHDKFGVNLNWLLTGKGEPYLSPTGKRGINGEEGIPFPEDLSKGLEPGQSDMLGQFMDKSCARDISLSLAELERLKPEAFKEVGIFIKGLLAGVRIMSSESQEYTGPDRRFTERRVEDNPKKFKGAEDRRSGKDRRAGVIR